MSDFFRVLKNDSLTSARTGVIKTSRGEIKTPVFMPVGTQGTVKTLSVPELKSLGVEIILNNAYHLFLRPGMEVIRNARGIHSFISWDKPILTDSGGFQVFSLAQFRKISEDGVLFRSHMDGSKIFLSPEIMTEFQTLLGVDIMMCFDECSDYPITYKKAKDSMELTLRWAKRCKEKFRELEKNSQRSTLNSQFLFGIVQGSVYSDLRRESARKTVEMGFDGYAIGGLSVGEPRNEMFDALNAVMPEFPEQKPRYFMGLGTPEDIWEAIEAGVDMFDCVLPTRNGRNGQAFTFDGKINIKNAQYQNDFSPLDEKCGCPACGNYSRAFINHLFKVKEFLAGRLLSLHNINFLIKLMSVVRDAISKGEFKDEKDRFIKRYSAG